MVSGSSTPIRPLPCDANEVSWAIAEKSLVNESAVMLTEAAVVGAAEDPGAAVVAAAPLVVEVEELDLELLHAASPAVVNAATVMTLTRFSEKLILPPVSVVQ